MCVPAIHTAGLWCARGARGPNSRAVGDEVSLEGRKVAPLCAFTLCCPVCLPANEQRDSWIREPVRLRVRRRIVKRYVARWNVRRETFEPHPDKVIRRKGNEPMSHLYRYCTRNPIVPWKRSSQLRRKNSYNSLLNIDCVVP